MSTYEALPRILVIDDLLGRQLSGGDNPERRTFCRAYSLLDVTDQEAVAQGRTERKLLAEAVFCRGQKPLLAKAGDIVENSLDHVLDTVKSGFVDGTTHWCLVLLDLSFMTGPVTAGADPAGMPSGRPADTVPSGYFGMTVLENLRRLFPDLPVLVLSGNPREDVSLRLDEQGAVGFVVKGAASSADVLRNAIYKHGLIPDGDPETLPAAIVGRSLPLLRAMRTARLAAQGNRNVLIRGDNGTGKELIAGYIHRHSPTRRQKRPFEVVNSARLTPEMYQNELFGYKKGSFTGADADREGLLKKAEGGDLFLDEIAELNAEVQAGLLRLLETREYSPNGAPEERVELKNIRFLSASNADLAIRVGRGDFREDLYHRLREFAEEVYLPPLRERPSDIPCLTEHFVRKFEREFAAQSREITKGALEVLCRYPWPGNVRELRNYLYVAIARYDQAEYLSPAHLPEVLRNYAGKTWEADLGDGDASGCGPKASIASVLLDVERQLKDSAGLDAKRLALYVKAALDAFLAESRCKSEK